MGVASIIISSGQIRECASSGVGVLNYVHVRDSETEFPGKHYKPLSVVKAGSIIFCSK